jgi:sirohydrochlorin cobaltochelatase
MPDPTYLVVGHGSRVPEAVAQFCRFVDALADHIDRPVHHCFLELVDPDVATGLTDAAERVGAGGDVVVLPFVLGAGGHQKNDVAVGVQWAREQFPAVNFRYGTPLGPHAKLIDLLDLRVNQALETASDPAPRESTRVLVVGRGSSDPTSNSAVAKSAYLLFEGRPYRSVEYGFQAVARPRVAEAVRRCAALGAEQLVVAPYLLFTGRVDRSIKRVADQAADELALRVVHADTLGLHPLLLDVAAQRFQEAADGTAAMVCDICKYRWPMAGYEEQVGEPQTTHHLHGGPDHDHHHHHHHDHD